MAQLFVSHSSADNDLALRVREALGELGYDSVFLDVSPADGLVPGAAWRDQLFSNLDHSDAVVFVGTPSANASLWCHSELALARWLRKPLLSLLFDDVDPHELVADIQGVNLASADLSPDLLRPALGALGLEQSTRWDAQRSPFPGLRPFDESYAPVFFGRESQIEQLRRLVDPPSRSRQGIVVPVLGPSGSGKSSLVRAGLVAALRPVPDWVVSDPWTPSDSPLAELALALAHAAKRHEVALDAGDCAELIAGAGGIQEYLRRLREGSRVPADARVLVVIDQAEELVTLTAEAERKEFLETLARCCAPPSPLRVVMTARTDMWDSVSALANRSAMTIAPAVLHVPPLSRSDLSRVIAEPAKRSHLVLEDGLLQRLVEDTESGDALPLLAYTLSRMTALATDGQLTHVLYDQVGGVRGAIASRSAEVAHGARTEGEVAAAILNIVGAGESRPVTRLAPVESVPAPQRAILDDLVDARLVVIRESAGHQVYAPAHEALFSAWPPLAETISNRHDDLRLRSRLERRTADWREAGSGTSGLLIGDELEAAVAWAGRSPDLTTPDVSVYVGASSARARRSRVIKWGVTAVVAVLALALVGVVFTSVRNAGRQQRFAELLGLASLTRSTDPVVAAVAVLEASDLDGSDPTIREVAGSLMGSAARDVAAPEGPPQTLLGLYRGSRLSATLGSGSDIPLWDATTGEVARTLPDAGVAVAVRPDDRVAVAATSAGLVAFDLAEDPAAPLTTFGPTAVQRLAYSPDGSMLAALSGTVITVWDLSDPAAPTQLAAWRNARQVGNPLVIDDQGRVLAVAAGTGASDVRLLRWAALTDAQPESLVTLPAAALQATALSVDAAGERALLGYPVLGSALPVYDLGDGSTINAFQAGSPTDDSGQPSLLGATWTAALSPDGKRVVAFDLAGRGFVFDVDTGDLVHELGSSSGVISGAVFVDDSLLLTAGLDGTVRTWDVTAEESGSDPSREEICAAFGARIGADDWSAVMGSEPFTSPCPDAAEPRPEGDLTTSAPPASTGPPAARTPTKVALEADFDDGEAPFAVGSAELSTGEIDRAVRSGSYRFTADGLAPGFHAWSSTPLAGMGRRFGVSTEILPADGSEEPTDRCGVMFGSDTLQATITVARPGSDVAAAGVGAVTYFADGQQVGETTFTYPAEPGPLTLDVTADELVVDVRVGDRVVARVDDPGLPAANAAGVVAVGPDSTCDFDRFTVRTE